MSTEILRIGRVVEITGSTVIGELETSVEDLYRTYKSRRYAIGQVGSVVKIASGDALVFGMVTSLRMTTKSDETPDAPSYRSEAPTAKWVEIELFGQGDRTGYGNDTFEFERGVASYPLPGQPIYLASVDELRRVYAKPDRDTVKVGHVSQAAMLDVHLMVDELLGKHFAILGTTGSGKSCAVALMLQSIIENYPNAHVILLDPHDEYPSAFPNRAELIDPTSLLIPHWLLNFEESVELFVGRSEFAATSQTNILKDAILRARKAFPNLSCPQDKITVDTPVPYRLGDLVLAITQAMPTQESKQESYRKILSKIDTLRSDKRFEFLMRPDETVTDQLPSLLGSLFRIPTGEHPLSIINLSGVPSDVTDVVVSVLCRCVFDFSVWNPRRNGTPILLVCEEAHRYAPRGTDAAFQPAKKALSRIAKEGRKYGVGLTLVTQRPSELSETILSQCNTVIALRMSNEQDQQFVRKALPDSVRSLVDSLPALRTREALVVGEGVSVPVRLFFDNIPEYRRPRSSDVPFAQAWRDNPGSEETLREAIRRWREQDRTVTDPH